MVCVLGLLFGLLSYSHVKNLPVHRSMAEISELIYETCKAYMVQQGKLLLVLLGFIGTVIVVYFTADRPRAPEDPRSSSSSALIGMAGSYGVAWFGIRINTLANSRTAFASLGARPGRCARFRFASGMSVGMMLISVELLFMLGILLFIPGEVAGACFLGFAIGESLGAAALRIAGGIFTKIADIGVGPDEGGVQDQGRRRPEPRRDRRLHRRQRRRLGGPDRRRLRDLRRHRRRADLVHRAGGEGHRGAGPAAGLDLPDARDDGAGLGAPIWSTTPIATARYATADEVQLRGAAHQLVWLTSIVSVILTYLLSYCSSPISAATPTLWWQLSTVITCGTLAGAIIPELVKVFTSTDSRHVREVVTSSREGGASLNILSGLVAGNFTPTGWASPSWA